MPAFRKEAKNMYSFKPETDKASFDEFVERNKGTYMQCSSWPEVKSSWTPYMYSGFDGDERVLTALVLERKLPVVGKLWYISCGAVCDYKNETLVSEFSDFIKSEMKSHGAFCVIVDPLITLRINGETKQEGVDAHKLFTNLGYELNTDLDSYTYKHPVQTMIPMKNENGESIAPEKILKGCDKGVRYSVRVGNSRGLTYSIYRYDDVEKDPSIMASFMEVMGDTSDRNSFVNRDSNYVSNLMRIMKDYTDITVVYYDKSLDKKLNDERLARKEQALKELETAPQKKVRGLHDEIDVINKNNASYEQRVNETSEYPDDAKIAVAAGLTIRYGGVASCVFGGTRNIVRNNTRSSHYLNYIRICESYKENMDFHDLGYVLCDNPEPPTTSDGTLGELKPRENFIGINDFKMSFGASYCEFIGEYILIGNRLRYWIYKELMPGAKKAKMKMVRLLRKANS